MSLGLQATGRRPDDGHWVPAPAQSGRMRNVHAPAEIDAAFVWQTEWRCEQ